jgi:hypothetical protein
VTLNELIEPNSRRSFKLSQVVNSGGSFPPGNPSRRLSLMSGVSMKPVVAHFQSEPLVVALAPVVVLACGCMMIPKQRGDALAIDRKSFLLPPLDELLFPFPWMDLNGESHLLL